MSRGYMCDLCGTCIDNEHDARNQREIQRGTVTVKTVPVEMYLALGASVPHVCADCWTVLMKKLKQWAIANIAD